MQAVNHRHVSNQPKTSIIKSALSGAIAGEFLALGSNAYKYLTKKPEILTADEFNHSENLRNLYSKSQNPYADYRALASKRLESFEVMFGKNFKKSLPKYALIGAGVGALMVVIDKIVKKVKNN